jgi:hypothetical protein
VTPRTWPADGTRSYRPLFALGALFLSGYALTLSRAHDWDSLAYAARVAGDPLLSEKYLSTRFFHPHHLLYDAFGSLARALLVPLGLGRDALLPLQVADCVLGAGCVVLLGALVQAATGRTARALFIAAAAGLSNAVWIYSTDVEVMIPALFFTLAAAFLLFRARSPFGEVAAGAAMALAILLHQLCVLPAAALILALALQRGRPAGRAVLPFALACVLPTLVLYLGVGAAAGGVRSPAGFLDWALAARGRSAFGTEPLATGIRQAARALAESLVSLGPIARGALPRSALVSPGTGAARAAVWGVLAGFVLLAAGGVRGALRSRPAGPVGAGLAAGTLALALFIGWFQPWNVDYWVYVIACGWLLIGLHLQAPRRGRMAAAMAAAFYLFALGAVNLAFRAIPSLDPANAEYRAAVRFAQTRLRPPGSLWIVGNGHRLGSGLVAIPLFARVAVEVAPGSEDPAGTGRLREQLERARATGRRVYASAEALRSLADLGPLPTDARPAGVLEGDTVFVLSFVEPAAQLR